MILQVFKVSISVDNYKCIMYSKYTNNKVTGLFKNVKDLLT